MGTPTHSSSGASGRRIYMIAGEASGDLHGGNLLRALFQQASEPLEVRAWGGDRMAAAGAVLAKHYRELAFMGFTQVLMNLRTILRNIEACKRDITSFRPDALVLIDYPGFNLRIAEWAHAKGIPVHYYISPQVWAWKKGRVHAIKRVVSRMYCILPFEQGWYARYGVKVDFVGHPLLDAIEYEGRSELAPLPGDDGRPVVALLPGSRHQEISRVLPLMAAVARRFPEQRFVLAAAPSVPDEAYDAHISGTGIALVKGRTYDVLRHARAALVTSGTATLETALFGVPEVVCYSGGALNVWIARRLVDIKFISLVNLIMDREVVRELIQGDLTVDAMSLELEKLLRDGPDRSRMLNDLEALKTKLGGPGASAKVASAVWISLHRAG
ncbi:MAG: lipid-A-disaccharide synthase [Flavobacteriales bacterium]|nr:lipid-A-disaccharide synthase [Flavobacteriales bacterium]